MRGIILAGGTGSRLLPLTKVTNKHLLPVGNLPMIMHPLGKLIRAGIRDIMVVTGTEHAGDIFELIGSGADLGCSTTFRVQDKADGIAGALRLARDFVREDPFVVLLGDNIFGDELRRYVAAFEAHAKEAPMWQPVGMVLLKEVPDPERFGVAVFEEKQLMRLEEKPSKPSPSNLAVTGAYFYRGQAIFDLIDSLKPSGRGEYEITDVNQWLLANGNLHFDALSSYWSDAGTFDSLSKANEMLINGRNGFFMRKPMTMLELAKEELQGFPIPTSPTSP